ncbi:TetR/AcrR family transcriptional regulator [Rossellomorea arthrocnemi]|uniref:TetR/AcrR family transcriptional regulator n=1 Tax=Rossellomorea arthrocnemi TaxID=2769542 RepID=UPI0019186103|nr:TetR/AcrR family transcriptional regulator [Rossellomorea arthrocnemi]
MARPADNYPAKRKELLTIAESIFLKKGYEQTSINDILNASGISKGAFYHYFKSKDEVLAASIDNLLDEAVAFLLPTVDDPNLGAMDKFNKFMEQKSKFQTAKMEYATLLGKLMNSGVFQQKYMFAMSHKMVPLFAKIIQQGKDEGIFQIEYPYETADILIRSIVGVPNSYAYKEYMSDDEKRKRYLLSLRGIIAGALGIEKHGFSL